MSQHDQMLERMRRINPVADLDVIHDSDLASLTSLLDQGRLAMTDLKQPVRKQTSGRDPGPRRWRRPAQAFAAALVLVLGTIGVVALLLPGEADDVGSGPVTPTVIPVPELFAGALERSTVGFMAGDVVNTGFGLVVAAWDGGVWISNDGAQWRQVLDVPFESVEGPQDATGLTVPPQARVASIVRYVVEFDSVLYAFGDADTDSGEFERVVWRSEDGATWDRTPLPTTSLMEGGVSGAAVGEDTLLAYIGYPDYPDAGTSIFLSGDGTNWTVVEPTEAGLEGIVLSNVMVIGAGFVAIGEDSTPDGDLYPWGRRMLFTSDTGAVWELVPGSVFPFDAFPYQAIAQVDGTLYVAGGVFDGDWPRPAVWTSEDLRLFEQVELDPALATSAGFVRDLIPTARGVLLVAALNDTGVDGSQQIALLASAGGSAFELIEDPEDLFAAGYPDSSVVFGDQLLIFGQVAAGWYQWTWTPES